VRGFSARICVSGSSQRTTTCYASTTSSPAPSANVEGLLRNSRFELMRPTSHFPVRRSRSDLQTACPASRFITSPIRCRPRRPACTADHTCWGWPSGVKARILQASTSEGYGDPECIHRSKPTGKSQSDRPAQLLRRRQALRRDAVLRLLATHQLDIKVGGSSTPTARGCIPNDRGW